MHSSWVKTIKPLMIAFLSIFVLALLGCGQSVVDETKVSCRSPNPDRKPTNIQAWKFNAVRDAILKVAPSTSEGATGSELGELVAAELPPEELQRLGSVSYFTEKVRLEMEVRGELERITGERTRFRATP